VRSGMTKPLILHVAAFRNPAGGGFVQSLARLAERNRSFDTALLCPSAQHTWVPAARACGLYVYTAYTDLDVIATIARLRPHVVHAHFVEWSVPAMLGAAAARARLAWHLHSGLPQGRTALTLARRLKYAVAKRFVDRFYCVSPDLVDYLEGFGIDRSQIVELPNGVDLDRYRAPVLHERVAARRRYGLAPDDRAVVFFARNANIKGADRLARAVTRARSHLKILAIAADDESLKELRWTDLRAAGYLSDVRDAIWAGDALAMPSRSEGIAYSLLEARSCGLPAVVSDLPGIARVFSSDPGTTLIDTQDAVIFARELEKTVTRGSVPLPDPLRAAISVDCWAETLAQWYVQKPAA
jgi:glycosyltransferase involved in cell wall biosynthesis